LILASEAGMSRVRSKISPAGRLAVPVQVRRAMGLPKGGDVVIELEGRSMRVRTLAETVGDAQALSRKLLRGKRKASVDAFLAERRHDAETE